MRKSILLLATLLIAAPATAKVMTWHGTVESKIGAMGSTARTHTGVATINSSSGGAHLSTLRFAGGMTGSSVMPLTDPNVTGTIKSFILTGSLGTGTITGISGAPPLGQNILPIQGYTRVCLFTDNCMANIAMNNTQNNGNTGVGIGGFLTMGGNGELRISIGCAPWTIGTVNQVNQTVRGNFLTLSRVGFVHGGASATDSSTAVTSGVIQFIGPHAVTTVGAPGNGLAQSMFVNMTFRFIPEPGLLLLLGSGVVGLGLLGRSRLKK